MTKLLFGLSSFALISSLSMPLSYASNGVYLITDHPDDPLNHTKYTTELDDLHVTDAGYLKFGPNHYMLGWRLEDTVAPTFAPPQDRLGLVKTIPSQSLGMPTGSITAILALNNSLGGRANFSSTIYDHYGLSHELLTRFLMVDAQSWQVSFVIPEAVNIMHYVPSTPPIEDNSMTDAVQYAFNFNAQGTLSEILAPDGEALYAPLAFDIHWKDGSIQHVTFGFGDMDLPAGDLGATEEKAIPATDVFRLKSYQQDGQGLLEVVGSHIDAGATFYTHYNDMSSHASYQIARVALKGLNTWETVSYTPEELSYIQDMIRYAD